MKQYDKFSKILSAAVDLAGLHKNEMIRCLEMDRSSYFQILKGTRLPTKEQYRALNRLLLLPQEEKVHLDDSYYQAVLGEETWEDLTQVRNCIRLLHETGEISPGASPETAAPPKQLPAKAEKTDPSCPRTRCLRGRQEAAAALEELLQDCVSGGSLDFFMPAASEMFYTALQRLAGQVRGNFRIRQLAGLPGGRLADRNEAIRVFQGLLYFLSSRSDIQLECRYYYNSVSKMSDIGLLYPWYVLTEKGVLMFSPDLGSAVLSRDEELRRAWSDSFTQAFSRSEPILKKYGSLEQNLRAVRDFLKGKQEVNYEAIPCTAMIVTPEMIRKYVIPQAQEELISHCGELQENETMVDISSISGLRHFLKTRKIPEIPDSFMRPVETEDLIWYMDNLLERLGKTLFIIDESRIPPAYDWDITIIEENSVLIHHHNYDTMILDEKNIVDMFTSFAVHIPETSYVLEEEKARKELLDIRSELAQQLQRELS